MEVLSLRELKKFITLLGVSNHRLVPIPANPGFDRNLLKITSDYGRIVIPISEDIAAILDQPLTFNPFDNLDQGTRTVGKDYAVYICMDDRDSDYEIVVSESFDAPQTSHQHCRMIGYFHNGPDANQADGIILPFSVFSDPTAKYKGMVAVGDYSGQHNNHAPFKIDIYRAVDTGEDIVMLTGTGVSHTVDRVAPIYGQRGLEASFWDAVVMLAAVGKRLPSNLEWTTASLGVSSSAQLSGNTNGDSPGDRSFWGMYNVREQYPSEYVGEWIMERYSSEDTINNWTTKWVKDTEEGIPDLIDSNNGAPVMGVKGGIANVCDADSVNSVIGNLPSILVRGGAQLGSLCLGLDGESSVPARFRGVRP